MSDRIKNDESLREEVDQNFVRNPIIIVEQLESGNQQYRVFINVLDQAQGDPRFAGILLSDLLDHIVAAYHSVTGRDVRALRENIFKTMRDEDKFKERDPTRGRGRGVTVWPKKN